MVGVVLHYVVLIQLDDLTFILLYAATPLFNWLQRDCCPVVVHIVRVPVVPSADINRIIDRHRLLSESGSPRSESRFRSCDLDYAMIEFHHRVSFTCLLDVFDAFVELVEDSALPSEHLLQRGVTMSFHLT